MLGIFLALISLVNSQEPLSFLNAKINCESQDGILAGYDSIEEANGIHTQYPDRGLVVKCV